MTFIDLLGEEMLEAEVGRLVHSHSSRLASVAKACPGFMNKQVDAPLPGMLMSSEKEQCV